MARLYMMLLLTLRGNPIIYQGEELGLPQAQVPFSHLKDPEAIANWPKTLGRDGARTPMPWKAGQLNAGFSSGEPWLPVDPAHDALAVDQQQGNDSVLRFTSEALSTRKRFQAMLTGGMTFLETGQEHFWRCVVSAEMATWWRCSISVMVRLRSAKTLFAKEICCSLQSLLRKICYKHGSFRSGPVLGARGK